MDHFFDEPTVSFIDILKDGDKMKADNELNILRSLVNLNNNLVNLQKYLTKINNFEECIFREINCLSARIKNIEKFLKDNQTLSTKSSE